MKRTIYAMAIVLSAAGVTGSVNAQFVVSDPGVEGETAAAVAELGTANGTLGRIAVSTQATATTVADTLTMFNAPTATLAPSVARLDGGGGREAASDPTEYLPQLNGATATSATSTGLLTAERAAVLADEAKGLVSGDPLMQQAERQRLIGTNLQGEVYNDDLVYAARFLAADTMLARLTGANIKDAIVLSGGVQVEILKQLSLIGQSITTNTSAATEAWLSKLKAWFQYSRDHSQAALLFKI